MLFYDEKVQRFELVLAAGDKGTICQVKYCTREKPPHDSGKYTLKICHCCRDRRWRANNPEKHVFNNLKKSAKSRGVVFTITFVEFLEVICGTDYVEKRGKKNNALQIDREKNELGYVAGNLRVITAFDNGSKHNWQYYPAPDCPF